jgi:hypothetical protein
LNLLFSWLRALPTNIATLPTTCLRKTGHFYFSLRLHSEQVSCYLLDCWPPWLCSMRPEPPVYFAQLLFPVSITGLANKICLINILAHITYKDQLKMGWYFTCKSWNCKTTTRKHMGKASWHWSGQLDVIPKAQATKTK